MDTNIDNVNDESVVIEESIADAESVAEDDVVSILSLPMEVIRVIGQFLSIDDTQAFGQALPVFAVALEDHYYAEIFARDFGDIKNKTIEKTLKVARRKAPTLHAERNQYLRMKKLVLKRNVSFVKSHGHLVGPNQRTGRRRFYFETADLKNINMLCMAMDSARCKDTQFCGAHLSSATFTGTDLRNTSFKGARLVYASFVGAQADGADFSGADLTGVSFYGASLRGAKFVGAKIDLAVFVGADITGADWTGAFLILQVEHKFFHITLDTDGIEAQRTDLSLLYAPR